MDFEPMQLTSIPFLFYFLPAFLVIYYLLPEDRRPLGLTLGSLLFLWLASGGSFLALGVLLGLTAAGYAAVRYGRDRRWLTAAAVALFAGTLVFFKIYRRGSLLPVGLSFYVFQLIAFTVEARRGRLGEQGPGAFAAGIVMFPKLLSGPLTDPADTQKQLRRPHRTMFTFHMGLRELILGLALKVILADRAAAPWARAGVMGFDSVSAPFLWLALISWCLRLYLDFYGYSLMAVGLGHMLGFHLPMNFLEPYSARTVSEFFRRWHATLGRWFREYVYIPLGGNRRGTGRTLLNLAIVWLLTGLWHGVGGGYLLWAAILWALIALERLWLRDRLERTRVLCHVYTVLAIVLSWVPFAAGGVGEAVTVFGRLLGIGPGPGSLDDFLRWDRQSMLVIAAGLFFATPVPKMLWQRVQAAGRTRPWVQWAVDGALFALFWVSVYFVSTSAQDPFLYFQF